MNDEKIEFRFKQALPEPPRPRDRTVRLKGPVSAFYGRTIVEAKLRLSQDNSDYLELKFADGESIRISDDVTYCCEIRYMRTDDDFTQLIGHRLVAVEANAIEGPGGEEHEVAFLDVKTDHGMVSFSFHNKQNGFYTGFNLAVSLVVP